MSEERQPAAAVIQERFGAQIHTFRDQTSLILTADTIVEACRALRDDFGFNMLSGQSAVDYWPAESPRFHVIYQLLSVGTRERIGLRVPVSGENPSVPSIEEIFPNANWYEREIWDMFGIRFENHADLRRILMPFDWQGHPLRKDYPLGYEEVQFSFNFDEIEKRKPYAKDE
jgi:NADH-quinone oxidoreductase subunit C